MWIISDLQEVETDIPPRWVYSFQSEEDAHRFSRLPILIGNPIDIPETSIEVTHRHNSYDSMGGVRYKLWRRRG